MSDTPRTDAQKRGDFVHINFARELERENAALRELLHRSLFWLDDYDSRFSGSAKIADDIKEVLRKEAQQHFNRTR